MIVEPSLSLDFVNSQQLDPRVTFTRSSIATRINNIGVMETVPANTPRFDYAPADIEMFGAELVTNGDFSNGTTNWNASSLTQQVVNGQLVATATSVSGQETVQTVSVTVGKTYVFSGEIKADIANAIGKSARLRIRVGGTYIGGVEVDVNGTSKNVQITYTATTSSVEVCLGVASISAWGAIGDKAYFDNISVKEVMRVASGTQINLVNLFLRSNDLTNAVWVKTGATYSAQKFIPSAGQSAGKITQVNTLEAASAYTFAMLVSAAEMSKIAAVSNATGTYRAAVFDLVAKSATAGTEWAASIFEVSSGLFLCACSATADVSASKEFQLSNNSTGLVGNGTNGVNVFAVGLFQGALTAQEIFAKGGIPITGISPNKPIYTESAGECRGLLIEEQRTNLLTYSEQFDHSSWQKAKSSVSTNATSSPDGSVSAEYLIEDTQAGSHYLSKGYPVAVSTPVVASYFVKAGTRTKVVLDITDTVVYASFASATFDLVAGTVVATSGTASIQNVGNGWYRCSLAGTSHPTNAGALSRVFLYNGTATNYTGDGVSGVYVWGAQLEVGTFPTSYIPTLSTFTSRASSGTSFRPVSYGAELCSSTTSTTGWTAAGTSSSISSNGTSITITNGGTFEASALVNNALLQAGKLYKVSCKLDAMSDANAAYVVLGIQNMPMSTVGLTKEAIILVGTTTTDLRVATGTSGAGRSVTFSSISVREVILDRAGDPITLFNAPVNVARIDYVPVTGEYKGILLEEQRTNLLTYSENFENLAWVYGNCTVTANQDTSPDGTVDADKLEALGLVTTAYQLATVAASTSYTFSFYVKLGTLPLSSFKIAVYNATDSAFIAVDVVPTQIPTTTKWTRIIYTFTTPVGCTSVRVYPLRNSVAITGSIYVWGAQLEAGASHTSYIPTTSAASTRSADVGASSIATRAADIANINNISPWFNPSEGAVCCEFLKNDNAPIDAYPFLVGFGLSNNYIGAFVTANSKNVAIRVDVDGSSTGVVNVGAINKGVRNSICFAFSTGIQGVLNGAISSFAVAPNGLPSVTSMSIGGFNGQLWFINGHIKSLCYFPKCLDNTDLIKLTK